MERERPDPVHRVAIRSTVLRACIAPTLALACAVLPPATAWGRTELYGVLDVWFGTIREAPAGGAAASRTVVDPGGLQDSYIGIRGSEDLADGLKAIFQLEGWLRPDTGASGRDGADPFWGRSAVAGFQGDFGRVTYGRNLTPYLAATTRFNPMGESSTFSPMIAHGLAGPVAGDFAMSNSVRLSSRTREKWRADLLWSAGEERNTQPDRGRGRALDWAVFYADGPFEASLARRWIDLSGTISAGDGRDLEAWLAGVRYDAGPAVVFAQYQDVDDSGADAQTSSGARTWQLGLAVPAAGGHILGSWASSRLSDSDETTPGRRATWAIGYRRELSRRTDAYAMAWRDEFSEPAGDQARRIGLGLRHRF
jgi:predicted porin